MIRIRKRLRWLAQNIKRYAPVAHYMAMAQAQREFSGTFGGLFWWIMEPLFYSAVYYFVFAVVFHTKTDNFIAFLLLGLVIWRWFTRSVKAAGSSLVQNASLMRQVDIPKVIFPVQAIIVETYKFLVALIVTVALLAVLGLVSWSTAGYFIPVFFTAFALFIGAGLMLSAVMPFFPDLKKLINLAFQALLFLSGVFYEAERVPEKIRIYFYFNPMASIIESFRDVLFFGRAPDGSAMAIVFLSGLGLCAAGLYLHWRYNRVFPRYLV